MTARWTVTARRLQGAPYTAYTLRVGKQVILSRLEPIGDQEASARVSAHLHPAPVTSRTDNMREFLAPPKAGRPRKAPTVNSRGFLWKDDDAV